MTSYTDVLRARLNGYIDGLHYALEAIEDGHRSWIKEELESAERILNIDYGGAEE